MELYPKRKRKPETRWRHASKYNNKAECEANGGKWINFHNFLEILPDKTKDECKGTSLIWAIPYRSEDIDQLEGEDPEMWKKCLVKLTEPDCIEAPRTRTNHLGNGKGIVPLTYKWTLPHFPSGQEQRCVLRIRYVIPRSAKTNVSCYSEHCYFLLPLKTVITLVYILNGFFLYSFLGTIFPLTTTIHGT